MFLEKCTTGLSKLSKRPQKHFFKKRKKTPKLATSQMFQLQLSKIHQ